MHGGVRRYVAVSAVKARRRGPAGDLGRLDASEPEEAVRAMLDVLKTTSGTGSVAICAQAVADAREAVSQWVNGSTCIKYVEEKLGQQISSGDWERTLEDVLAQQPKDIGNTAARNAAQKARAALRDRVDSLSLTGLSKATRVQKKSMETLINTLEGGCSKLERPYNITDGELEALVGKVRTAYDDVQAAATDSE